MGNCVITRVVYLLDVSLFNVLLMDKTIVIKTNIFNTIE